LKILWVTANKENAGGEMRGERRREK
jgi:hypothetical protein